MGYGLGIDVGTTFTAAALFRDGNVEVFPLATYQNAVPSVIFADGDDLLFAGAAERRGASQPLGLAREFKRRLGDPVPIVLSGAPYHADRLTALMARWVADSVTEQVGEPPDRIVMTHPANWTEYQLGMLRNALADVGLGTTELISEPTAATLEYAAAANVEPNSSVLVYDLGGGTFDVALLRRHGDTFEQQIEPAGIERLGGIDFDEAVFQYVKAEIPADAYAAAREHPDGPAAIAQLRRRCVDAKEALSSDAAGDVPVMLPGYTATVRITRPEFEAMIRPMVRQTIGLVEGILERADVDSSSLGAVLLVGGSSRIPLVPQLVSEQLRLPVRVDAHPKLVVARGAARQAGIEAADDAKPSRWARAPRQPEQVEVGDDDEGGRPIVRLAVIAALLLAAAAAAYLLFFRDDDGGDAAPTTTVAEPDYLDWRVGGGRPHHGGLELADDDAGERCCRGAGSGALGGADRRADRQCPGAVGRHRQRRVRQSGRCRLSRHRRRRVATVVGPGRRDGLLVPLDRR